MYVFMPNTKVSLYCSCYSMHNCVLPADLKRNDRHLGVYSCVHTVYSDFYDQHLVIAKVGPEDTTQKKT